MTARVAKESSSIPDKVYFRIGEVSRIAGVKPHVVRYWETEFKEIRPIKSRANQRLYRRKDLDAVLKIKELLYVRRFTIEGARKHLRGHASVGEEDSQETQVRLDFMNKDLKKALTASIEELKKIKELLS